MHRFFGVVIMMSLAPYHDSPLTPSLSTIIVVIHTSTHHHWWNTLTLIPYDSQKKISTFHSVSQIQKKWAWASLCFLAYKKPFKSTLNPHLPLRKKGMGNPHEFIIIMFLWLVVPFLLGNATIFFCNRTPSGKHTRSELENHHAINW
jgi:hypothetical protein